MFRRRRWFQGQPIHGRLADIGWYTPDGAAMEDAHWDSAFAKSFTLFLNGTEIPSLGARGERIVDDRFLLCFNAHHEPLAFHVPEALTGHDWRVALDTASGRVEEPAGDRSAPFAPRPVTVDGRALVVLRAPVRGA